MGLNTAAPVATATDPKKLLTDNLQTVFSKIPDPSGFPGEGRTLAVPKALDLTDLLGLPERYPKLEGASFIVVDDQPGSFNFVLGGLVALGGLRVEAVLHRVGTAERSNLEMAVGSLVDKIVSRRRALFSDEKAPKRLFVCLDGALDGGVRGTQIHKALIAARDDEGRPLFEPKRVIITSSLATDPDVTRLWDQLGIRYCIKSWQAIVPLLAEIEEQLSRREGNAVGLPPVPSGRI